MTSARWCLLALVFLAVAVSAQKPKASVPQKPKVAAADSSENADEDDNDPEPRVQFGLAGGALQYVGGRKEQAAGAVVRWLPTPWLSLSATPTTIRASEPAITSSGSPTVRSGLTDLPVEATVSHGFAGPFSPSVGAALGITLPVGDTASGLGSGEMGYSVSGSLGLTPAEGWWVHAGAGRSLTRFSVGSAFSSGTGWGDISGGYSLSERISVSGGYSSDLGAVDSTLGRSTSLEGGLSFALTGKNTLNVNASHGLSGSAPQWSLALGFGTAFPYLTHLGAGAQALQNAFGGGTHGLGNPNGASGSTKPGRGRGRSG